MSEKGKGIEVDPTLYSVIQNSITAGVNEGVKRALIEIEKEKEEKKKHKADMRFRNTELLLHNYTNFMQHTEKSIYTETQLSKAELFDELDLDMDEEITKTQINSIIKSKNKTSIILKHINTFIDYYRYKCENSGREDIQRRIQVIELLYLNEDKKTQEEVSEILDCSDRTIRNTKNIAIKELSILFFGIDGLKIK
jgi:transcription initiation factor TFIIIB Brf1 subunit/transcription initiation factor TFIIB